MDDLPHPLPPGFELRRDAIETTWRTEDHWDPYHTCAPGLITGYINGEPVDWRVFAAAARAAAPSPDPDPAS